MRKYDKCANSIEMVVKRNTKITFSWHKEGFKGGVMLIYLILSWTRSLCQNLLFRSSQFHVWPHSTQKTRKLDINYTERADTSDLSLPITFCLTDITAYSLLVLQKLPDCCSLTNLTVNEQEWNHRLMILKMILTGMSHKKP